MEPSVSVAGGALDDATREAVFAVLREHNRTRAADHWAALDRPESASRPLAIVARGDDGRVLGGLTGATRLAWLKIEVLGVCEGARGKGLGRRLVAEAEREAVRRGCRHAYADTMSHQAPGFFARLGYDLAGRIDDWDSFGRAHFLYTKRLA